MDDHSGRECRFANKYGVGGRSVDGNFVLIPDVPVAATDADVQQADIVLIREVEVTPLYTHINPP